MGPIWGIDLGGTKIEGVILESRTSKRVLTRTRIATEAQQGYAHILNRIAQLVEVMMTQTGLKPDYIGIGTPGVLDPHSLTMKNCNSTALNGKPLQADLQRSLNLPVKMANDANCFAIAEATIGAVADHKPDAALVFGVIMGTGVGGGLVIHQQVVQGRQGIAGEWGHNFLDASGGTCYCGNIGCVERIISGPALERYYLQQKGVYRKLPEILSLHLQQKDEVANQTIARLIHFFGKGIASVVNILDPDVIVLGGGLSNIDLLYTEGVAEVQKHVFNNRLDTLFLRPKLGDSAGVFGAALL